MVDAAYFSALLTNLQASGFRDLPGGRVSAHIPLTRALLNRVAADAIRGSTAPLRSIDIVPRAGDQFDALITLTWPLVPTLKATFKIEQQPRFPESPFMVLRWSFLGGLGTFASRFVGSLKQLPAGVRLEDDRLVLDIAAMADRTPAGEVLRYLKTLELHTMDDQAIVDVELGVPAA